MTKEQIIQNIKARISTIESYRPDEYALNEGNLFELKDLLTMIEKDEPSIPSNLDEAEFEYAQSLDEIPANQEEEEMIYNAFKAGAKWIEGQFQKIEGGLVDWYSTSDGKDYCCGIKTDEAFEVPESFYIRKKQ